MRRGRREKQHAERTSPEKSLPRFSVVTRATLLIFAFAALLFLHSVTFASIDSAAVFDEAAAAYESEDFTAAIEKYESLLKSGYAGGVVYYNLGNAYFRSGDLGRAILNYRRAERLMPRDAELEENLVYCRALVIDEVKSAATPGPWEYVKQQLKKFSMNELTLAASALFALAMLLALAAIFIGAPKPKLFLKRIAWILLIVSLGMGSALGYMAYEHHKQPAVVVLDSRLEVMAGPGDDFSAIFILHEGAEATVLRTRGDWRQILFPSAGRGWVRAEAIEKI